MKDEAKYGAIIKENMLSSLTLSCLSFTNLILCLTY